MKILKRILSGSLILIGLLLLILVVSLGLDSLQTDYLETDELATASRNSYLIRNVNVIPMTRDTVLQGKMVHVKNGRIETIADSVAAPEAETIDAQNKYLVPGLIDMHVHVWDRYELGLYLSNGVTSIRNVWGMPMHLRLKEEIDKGALLSPQFVTTGPKLTGPEFIGDDNLQLTSPEEARDKVISYQARGYDYIKTYYGLTPELFDAILDQARRSGMDVVAHPSQKVPYSYHFNRQIVSIEHAEDIVQQPLEYKLDTLKLKQVVADFTKAPHTSFCPTLMAFYNIYNMLQDEDVLSSEAVRLMNPSIRMTDSKAQFERWSSTKKEDPGVVDRIKKQHDFHLYAVKNLHEAGVNLICGTDSGIGITVPGVSIHQELALYSQAGLSNYEVLRTATINASRVHQKLNKVGSIEEGKVANLLLIDENPLHDLSALKDPRAVFVKGIMLDEETLDLFVDKAINRGGLLASVIRYAENLIVEK